MQNKMKWPYWLVVRVTRPEPPIQVDPELLPFRGTRFRAAQSLVFCIVLCCSLFVLWSFFSFRHCIVCQTMTFFLLDIALSVKVWLFSFRHFIVGQTTTFFSFRHCIVCQTMTFFPLRHCIVCQAMTFVLLDIVLSVKLWLFSFRHFIVCQTMTFFLLDIVLSVKLWLFFFWTLYCLSSYDFIFS
jgi:hypothetical protein